MSNEVEKLLESAHKAVAAATDGAAADRAGWALRLDMPESTLKDANERPWQYLGALVALAATVLTVVILVMLLKLLEGGYHHQQAVTIVLAGGAVAGVLALCGVAWRSLAYAQRMPRLHLAIRADGSEEAAGTTVVSHGTTGVSHGAAPAEAPGEAAAAKGSASAGATGAGESGTFAKEPVIIGTLLLAAGTLAVGLAGKLNGEEVAAIAAGASAIIGLFVRQSVTPVAKPKDAENKALTPASK